MKKRRILIILLSILILAAIATAIPLYIALRGEDTYRFILRTKTADVLIDEWHDDSTGKDYLFLPSCATGETLVFDGNYSRIEIDGKAYRAGEPFKGIDLNREHTVSLFRNDSLAFKKKIIFMKSADVPSIHIKSESKAYATVRDKTQKERCTVYLIDPDGNADYIGTPLDKIRGHGNYTWRLPPKKSYNLYLQDRQPLLDMNSAQNWVLLADYMDTTHMRNKLAFEMADYLGMEYSPDSRWVDLYLDGEYRGLYLLTEKVEADINRVDVGEDGILFAFEYTDRLKGETGEYTTPRGQNLVVKEPDDIRESEMIALKAWADEVERLIYSDCSIDELNEKIDVASWVDKYLIEEWMTNFDAGLSSQYFYTKGSIATSRAYAGPCWDYDNSSGSIYPELVHALLMNRNFLEMDYASPWFSGLYAREDFSSLLKARYVAMRTELLNFIGKRITEYRETINGSANMDQIRWTNGDFDTDVDALVAYFGERSKFLSSVWETGDTKIFNITMIDKNYNYCYILTCPQGTTLSVDDLCAYPEQTEFLGWFMDSAYSQPLEEKFIPQSDMTIYVQRQESSSDIVEQTVDFGKMLPLVVVAFGVAFTVVLVLDVVRNRRRRNGN